MHGPIGLPTERHEKGDVVLNEITADHAGYHTQLCVPLMTSAFEGHTIGSSYLIREDEPEALHTSELGLIMVH